MTTAGPNEEARREGLLEATYAAAVHGVTHGDLMSLDEVPTALLDAFLVDNVLAPLMPSERFSLSDDYQLLSEAYARRPMEARFQALREERLYEAAYGEAYTRGCLRERV